MISLDGLWKQSFLRSLNIFFQNLIRKNIINVCLQRGKKQRSFYMIAKVDTIGCANYCFAYFYSGYSIFLSFVLIGIADKIWGHLHLLIDLLLLALPIEVCFIPAYSAVFSNDRYSKYFRQFEKEDEHWHKKWRGITILFIMGSIIFTIMGFLAMWGIDHLL